jgi:hypothetical protein
MRARVAAVSLALLMALAGESFAAEAPSYVIPGRNDVPVIVNPLGYDASYTVVEGDFGLDRPGQVNPVIVGPRVLPAPFYPGAYFPSEGRRPGYGRLEIEGAHRAPPRPAESFYRAWRTQSDPIPATLDPPASFPIDVLVDGRPPGDRDGRKLRRDRRDRPHHGR